MSDGVVVAAVGCERGVAGEGCIGCDTTVAAGVCSIGAVVAPSFSDFDGREWESEFPRVLVEYYRAVGGVGLRRYVGRYGSCGGVSGWLDVGNAGGETGIVSGGVASLEDRVGQSSGVDGGSGLCDGAFHGAAGTESGASNSGLVVGRNGEKVESFGEVKSEKGKNYKKNFARREKIKRMRGGAESSGVKVVVKSELQLSLEAKWEAENKLAVKQAERKIALLDARDIESEKKMQRAQIMRTTEAAKVQTERAYATLKRTGNVPGFAETVITDGSCPALSPSRSDGTCISPDSSVSQQEIRAMMKELEDCKLTLKRIERDNPALVAHHMEGHGVKTAFTLDSDGLCPVDEPGSMGADGKYHLDSYEPNPRFYKDRFRAEEFAEKYFGS